MMRGSLLFVIATAFAIATVESASQSAFEEALRPYKAASKRYYTRYEPNAADITNVEDTQVNGYSGVKPKPQQVESSTPIPAISYLAACGDDSEKLCKQRNAYGTTSCLRRNLNELSETCKVYVLAKVLCYQDLRDKHLCDPPTLVCLAKNIEKVSGVCAKSQFGRYVRESIASPSPASTSADSSSGPNDDPTPAPTLGTSRYFEAKRLGLLAPDGTVRKQTLNPDAELPSLYDKDGHMKVNEGASRQESKLQALSAVCRQDAKLLCGNADAYKAGTCLSMNEKALSEPCHEYHMAKVHCFKDLLLGSLCKDLEKPLACLKQVSPGKLRGPCRDSKFYLALMQGRE